MRIHNLLIVAATLLGFTTIVNAEVLTSPKNASIEVHANEGTSGFNLGFKPSANIELEKVVVSYKRVSSFGFGFNPSASTPSTKKIAPTKRLVNVEADQVKGTNKSLEGFSIGFNS